jgi:hypothetical protein
MKKKSAGLATLLDTLRERFSIKNDAALARDLEVAAPVVSKWRTGSMPLGAVHTTRMHETYGLSIKEIRELAAA